MSTPTGGPGAPSGATVRPGAGDGRVRTAPTPADVDVGPAEDDAGVTPPEGSAIPDEDGLGSGTITPAELDRAGALLRRVRQVFAQRVVGQDGLRTALLTTLLAGGHVLLESVPGLAKTTAAQTLAGAVSASFHRIQCTPDLMPNDIVGTQIYNYATGEFTTQLGPVHANFVLLDEINRSSAKTQSAMLEAMQEQQTSIGGEIYPVPRPFMVLATQNPIEEEGTYVLPEAQMDRFLLKEVVSYPTPHEEVEILERTSTGALTAPATARSISLADVRLLQNLVGRVYVDTSIKRYIVALVSTSRGGGPRPLPGWGDHVRVGASPRGGIALMRVAQAVALQEGRAYVVPDDVKQLRHAVLRHRLVRSYDALANNVAPESLIDAVFAAVPAP
ncbi:AAA family ATPase [Georgenia sp. TF02-10]|uniref:AAA family ATPase n=1 Tax=Georgenia sp. TF02-10 TaxID=2917725 RepID=UPI001FA7EFFE|nr:AAA family ATPase [Georgenia sp. TF02-10]UNX54695.1 AAA family ATPase [Georgenia sp. TF02-10]